MLGGRQGNQAGKVTWLLPRFPSPLIHFSFDLVTRLSGRGRETFLGGDCLYHCRCSLQKGNFYSVVRDSPAFAVSQSNPFGKEACLAVAYFSLQYHNDLIWNQVTLKKLIKRILKAPNLELLWVRRCSFHHRKYCLNRSI